MSRELKLISTTEASIQSNNISSTANCTKSTNEEVLQCLKSVDPVTLIKISKNVLRYPLIVLDEVIIKKQPSESFASGEFKNANLLIGSNTKEFANIDGNSKNLQELLKCNIYFKNFFCLVYL